MIVLFFFLILAFIHLYLENIPGILYIYHLYNEYFTYFYKELYKDLTYGITFTNGFIGFIINN